MPFYSREYGGSLLELMAVVLIVAVLATMTMPLFYQQMAAREIDTIARRFIPTHNLLVGRLWF